MEEYVAITINGDTVSKIEPSSMEQKIERTGGKLGSLGSVVNAIATHGFSLVRGGVVHNEGNQSTIFMARENPEK